MALIDDKRFILSHIRHSFITSDDSGTCEIVMLNENPNKYPYESIYHHHFDYYSDDDYDYGPNNFKYDEDEIDILKKSELEYQSELVDEDQPAQSLDIMPDSNDHQGFRRRSNTAQRLEKLKKEQKNQNKTKNVTWTNRTEIISQTEDGNIINIKRCVIDVDSLSPEELALLDYDDKENLYYETEEYRKHLYSKKEEEELEKEVKESNKNRKSLLTLTIEQSPEAPLNPFKEYTKFDGRVSENNLYIRIRIFFKVYENHPDFKPYDFTTRFGPSTNGINCGTNWIEIIVSAHARVCDLIGLICWHYTHLQIGPQLKPSISAYALHIAEENGEVDYDLPCLTSTEDIKRYRFDCLALVETQVAVTIHISSENVFSKNMFSSNTSLREIVEELKRKRSQLFKNKSEYNLELLSNPGVYLDLDKPVSHFQKDRVKSVEFSLVFTHNNQQFSGNNFLDLEHHGSEPRSFTIPKNTGGIRLNKSSSALYNLDNPSNTIPIKKRTRDPNDSSNMIDIMKAPLYQCFEVNAVSKLYNQPIEMGISDTKLEITPKPHARSSSSHFTERIFSKIQGIKAMNINIEDVVECHVVPIHKPVPNKQTFKIVYWNKTDFKSIKFTGDYSVVDDIVFKLQNVMMMHTSHRRKEYNTLKSRKKNISNKIYFKSRVISSGSSESGSDHDTHLDESSLSLKNRSKT